MRRMANLAGLLALGMVLWAGPALAYNDISGHWSGAWYSPGKGGPMELDLDQNGSKVTGTVTMKNTAAGDVTGVLQNSTFQAYQFRGSAQVTVDGQAVTLTLDATAADQRMDMGTFSSDKVLGSGTFEVSRQ